jgi:hypothetical protein
MEDKEKNCSSCDLNSVETLHHSQSSLSITEIPKKRLLVFSPRRRLNVTHPSTPEDSPCQAFRI